MASGNSSSPLRTRSEEELEEEPSRGHESSPYITRKNISSPPPLLTRAPHRVRVCHGVSASWYRRVRHSQSVEENVGGLTAD